MNKEVGGVALGFAGFVFLTMAFKGTYGRVWDALLGRKGSPNASATSPASTTVPIGGVTVGGGSSGAGSGRPGAAPGSGQNPFRGAL